jgi:hypothetical protein
MTVNKVMADIEQWLDESPATINGSGWEKVTSD